MSQAILNQILNQLKILEPEELHQLNQVIQTYLDDQKQATQQTKFHQALLTSGLVKQLKYHSSTRKNEWQLINVQGKPVSETMIEERRLWKTPITTPNV